MAYLPWRMYWLSLICFAWPMSLSADEPPAQQESAAKASLSGDSLKNLSARDLEALFRDGKAEPLPAGFARGRLLVVCGYRMPRLSIRLEEFAWKGKHFGDDGSFINQFAGFQALSSQAVMGTSWLDGKPCLVLEYAPGTPLFGNVRDEVRRIGPDLYLALAYERCPCPRIRRYISLTPDCK